MNQQHRRDQGLDSLEVGAEAGWEPEVELDLEGNGAAQSALAAASPPEEPPSLLDEVARLGPPPAGGGGDPDDLPFRPEMELAFGEDFSEVEVVRGADLRGIGARAAAAGERVAFATPHPDRETVAHELTHVVQARRAGEGPATAPPGVSAGSEAAEAEARAVAARVAAGGPAGPVTAAPSAAVHRDGVAPAPEPATRRLGPEVFAVWPDAAFAALSAMGPVVGISESQFRAKVDQAGRELVGHLVALHGLDLLTWHQRGKAEVARRVAEADPQVRVAALRLLAEHPQVLADVKLAEDLVASLDPVAELHGILGADAGAAWKVTKIQGWALHFGAESCKRALADGDIQVKLNTALGRGPSVRARMLLIGAGTLDETPRTRMLLALYDKDSAGFLAAWSALKTSDPQLALLYLSDASFLEDVRGWAKDAYPRIVEDVASFEPAASQGPATGVDALNTQARWESLLQLAGPLARRIEDQIVDTGGLDTLFGDPAEADPAFAAAADQVYAYRREVVAREAVDPSAPDGRAAAIGIEKEALEVLRAELRLDRLLGYGTGPGRARFLRAVETADHELGKRVLRDSGQTGLTPEEQANVQAVADRIAGRIAALDGGGLGAGAEAEQLLDAFGREAGGLVRPATSEDRHESWAADERRRAALAILDRTFEAKTGRKLRDWIRQLAGLYGLGVVGRFDLARREGDIADDPDAYSDQLTPLDHQRLGPVFSTHADRLGALVKRSGQSLPITDRIPEGMQVTGDWKNRRLQVDREYVAKDLAELQSSVRRILEPERQTGAFLAAWDRKVRTAMKAFEQQLDASHGSLRQALDVGRGDAQDQKSALVLLGDRDGAAFALQQQALMGVQGDARGAHAFLEELVPAVRSIAARLASALGPALEAPPPPPPQGVFAIPQYTPPVEALISDAKVLALAGEFAPLADRYGDAVPGGKRSDATGFLTAAFAPLGGSLAPPVAAGLDRDNADRALSLMGLQHRDLGGTQTADLELVRSGQAGPARQEDDATFTARLEARAAGFSRKLATLGDPGSEGRQRRFAALLDEAGTLVGLARLAEGGDLRLRTLWAGRVGIELAADLGRNLSGAAEREAMAAVFGLAASALPAGRTDQDVVRDLARVDPADLQDPYAFLRRAGVRPDQVDPDFTLAQARKRAAELHFALGRLPGSRREVLALVSHRPAEMTVVSQQYRELFGYDPRYRLQQVFPDDLEKVDEYAELVDTSGRGGPATQIVAYARTRDTKEVYRQVLRLSASERSAILADPAALGELRKALGGDYDRVYTALAGEATLYDVVRSDKDVGSDIEEFFEGRRRTLMDDPGLRERAGGDERRLEALVADRLRREGRQAFADPSMQKLLDEKFGASKDFEVRARLLGGGKLTRADEATKAVITDGDTDEAGLRAAVEGMSAEERALRRDDPFFQRRIASDLEEQDGDVKDARRVFAELYAEPGANGLAKLEETRRTPTDLALSGHRLPEYDPEKAMKVVLGMSAPELAALRANGDDLHRLRASLDEDRRKRLDAYLAAAARAGSSPSAHLVERYAARFLESRSSTKGVLQIAQECFAEKGQVPDPNGKPRSTFGSAERKQVWDRIEGKLDVGLSVVAAVRLALVDGVDPTAARLRYAFEGEDNQAEILAAIDNAGLDAVISWSNVLRPGPTREYGTLKGKLEAYVAAQAAMEASLRAGGDPQPPVEEQYLAARNRFLDHRLDLSVDAVEYFSGGGGDTVRLEQFGSVVAEWKDEPSRKRLLEMKDHVRKRILGLTADDVAARVGLVEPGPPAATGDPARDEQEKQRFEAEKAEYEARRSMLVSEDRTTRSEFQQRADVYEHQRGSSSGSGAETEGSRVDIAFHGYRTELAHGVGDSKLTPDEIARIRLAGGDFDRKVQEYKDAKARLGSILKLIAKALIVAVATVLTGGAGGVLATLLVAGTGAMADNVIDSVVMGNDFDWEEDGLKHLLKEVGTAAFTLGMSKAFTAVTAPLGIAGKFQKVAAFEERLAASASSSFGGMALNYAYQSGKSVVLSPLSAVSEGAIDMIDSSEWKYGWEDYGTFASETFQAKFDAIPDSLRAQLLENLATGLVTRGRGMLGGNRARLPGVEPASVPTPRSRSLARAVGRYLGTDALPDAIAGLTDEGLKLLAKKVAAQGADGLDFTEEEVVDFVLGLGARGTRAVAGAAGKQRRANAVADRVERERAGFGDDTDALAHYQAHLEGADMGLLGGLHADAAKFRAELAKKRAEVRARAANQPLGAQYEAWVLGAPGELQKRMAVSYDEFRERHEAGSRKLAEIRSSQAYADLSAEEKRLHERSASGTDAVLELGGRRSVLDLSVEGGADRFKAVARNTVVATVAANATSATQGWDPTKQRAFEAHLRDTDLAKLTAASGEDAETARIHAARIAVAFSERYEAEATKRAAGKRYVGDAPEVTLPKAAPKPNPQTPRPRGPDGPRSEDPDQITADRRAAMAEYDRRVGRDDTLEVAVYYDRDAGDFAVVQGGPNEVPWPRRAGNWALVEHWQPRGRDEDHAAPIARFPSGRNADLAILEAQARESDEISMSGVSSDQPWGRSRTIFGFDPHANEGRGEWFVDYATGWDDAAGREKRHRRTFLDLDEYATFLEVRAGEVGPELRNTRAVVPGSQQTLDPAQLDPNDRAELEQLARMRQHTRDNKDKTGGVAVFDPTTGAVHDENPTHWSRDLGEAAGRVYMRKQHPSYVELPQDLFEGARTFDLIFVDPSTGHVIVVEAKGGGAAAGQRKDGTEQGSPRYAKEVVGEYLARLDKEPVDDEYGELTQILQEAWTTNRLRYLLVSQPVDARGGLKAMKVSEFDVSRANRYRKPPGQR